MAELICEVKKFLRRKSRKMSQKKLSLGNGFGKSLQQRAKNGSVEILISIKRGLKPPCEEGSG